MTDSEKPLSREETIAAVLMEGMKIDTIAELDKVYVQMVEKRARELQNPKTNQCDRGETAGSDSAT